MYAQSAFKCMKFLRNRRDLCGKLMPGQRGGRGISNVLRLKKNRAENSFEPPVLKALKILRRIKWQRIQ